MASHYSQIPGQAGNDAKHKPGMTSAAAWCKKTGPSKDEPAYSIRNDSRLFYGVHVADHFYDFVGVTPFVIVPRNHFYEVFVELDTCFRIEDGSAGI